MVTKLFAGIYTLLIQIASHKKKKKKLHQQQINFNLEIHVTLMSTTTKWPWVVFFAFTIQTIFPN